MTSLTGDLLRLAVCTMRGGHILAPWSPVVDVHTDESGRVELYWSTNARTEIRYCLRCPFGYERREAPGPA